MRLSRENAIKHPLVIFRSAGICLWYSFGGLFARMLPVQQLADMFVDEIRAAMT
jgi:hypothetical protein